MTNEQAKSELMQIYMSLSEEKKQALDVLMTQADGEYQTKKSCETCKYSETFNLDCARCDDDMTNYAPKQADGEYISRTELLKAIDTWDRFGVDDTNSLFRLDNLSLPHYVPYIHYDDVVKCIKGMPSVKPQESLKYLTERPCVVCEFHTEKGCSKWDCVFDEV